ncbi:MAG: alpha/beta hydrolase [Pseudomonadota bacterium]
MYVTIDNNEIFYSTGKRDIVEGQPNIIFVHGVSLDSTTWTLYTRYYARRGYNVYTFDLPGHGHSQGDPSASMQEKGAWVAKFMDALDIPSAIVVGHSMGGLIAIETAIQFPDKVEKLALLGVALPMPVTPVFLEAAKNGDQLAIDMFVLFGYDFAAQLGGNPVSGISMLNTGLRIVERQKEGVMHAGLNVCNEYTPEQSRLDQIQCPVTLVIGRDDVMTPYKRALQLADNLPNSRVLDIPNCGHMLIIEKPEDVHVRLLDAVKN